MTATVTETIEALDLSDLDLLDDASRHATCDFCYPTPPPNGTPFVAWCGQRAMWLQDCPRYVVPPDACGDCSDPTRPCAGCGHP